MPGIEYEKRDHIAYITIYRPEAMNALGLEDNAEIIRGGPTSETIPTPGWLLSPGPATGPSAPVPI